MREIQFKKTQEVKAAQLQEKHLVAEVQGSRAAVRNLQGKVNQLDQESLKQHEILYNQVWIIHRMMYYI